MTVRQQTFGVSTTIADVFGYQPVDGILGLGWPSLAVDKVVPPMQNVLDQLDQPLFTVWLDRKVNIADGDNAGLITYGAVDNVNCEANIDYVALSALTYWQFPITVRIKTYRGYIEFRDSLLDPTPRPRSSRSSLTPVPPGWEPPTPFCPT